PRVTVDAGDPALNDDLVAQFFWYHTSTQPDWPSRDFDPAADLTPGIRRMMGGDERVTAWAARQRAKALHVGTYEAAVHNMLRRMRDQADRGNQFYLYRVHLKPLSQNGRAGSSIPATGLVTSSSPRSALQESTSHATSTTTRIQAGSHWRWDEMRSKAFSRSRYLCLMPGTPIG